MNRLGFLGRLLTMLGLGAVVSVGKPSLSESTPIPGHVLPPDPAHSPLRPCVKCCGTGGRYMPTDPTFYEHPLGPNPCCTGMKIAGPDDGPWVPCPYCATGTCPTCGEQSRDVYLGFINCRPCFNKETAEAGWPPVLRWKPNRVGSKSYVVDQELADLWGVPLGEELP